QRAEAHAARLSRRQRERGEGLQRVALGTPHQREEVVRAPQRLIAQLLCTAHDRPPPLPGQAFLPLDHDTKLHAISLSPGLARTFGSRKGTKTQRRDEPAILGLFASLREPSRPVTSWPRRSPGIHIPGWQPAAR